MHDGAVQEAAGPDAGCADPERADEDVGHLEEDVAGGHGEEISRVPKSEEERGQQERAVDGDVRVEAARGQFFEAAIELAHKDQVLCQGTNEPHGCRCAFEGVHGEPGIDDCRERYGHKRNQQDFPPMLFDAADADTAAQWPREGQEQSEEEAHTVERPAGGVVPIEPGQCFARNGGGQPPSGQRRESEREDQGQRE